jgi:hypothetical protein
VAFDLGSIHAAGITRTAILHHDLNKRPRNWLYDAAKTAAATVEQRLSGVAERMNATGRSPHRSP